MIALVGLIAIASCQIEFVEAAADPCHLREFDLCMASAVVFIQQPGNVKVSDAEVERQCQLFKETEKCIDDYTDKCMSPMQESLVEFMSGGMLKYMKDYCKKGSETRALYLKHAECVNKQRKNTNKCLVDFQAAIEVSTVDDTHWRDRPKVMCCALDRMRSCQRAIIEPACGHAAVEVAEMLIRGTFSRGATVMCSKYKHQNAECKRLLPPSGTKPKGAKSSSVLSKLLSTVTQV